MNPDAVLMSPDEVLATSVCKFAESFTRFTIDESAFSFNLSIAITSSSGLLLALLIKTLEIFHMQTRAFHTVRFTPCVSHRAFHTVRFTNPCPPPGSLTDTRFFWGSHRYACASQLVLMCHLVCQPAFVPNRRLCMCIPSIDRMCDVCMLHMWISSVNDVCTTTVDAGSR